MLLSTVFKRRKFQKRLTELASVRQTVSPPSPESFVSPEIVDINGKYDFSSDTSQEPYDSSRSSSPRVQLDLNFTDSISEWFPTNLLASETRSSQERLGRGAVPGIVRNASVLKQLPSIPLGSPEVLNVSSDNVALPDAQAETSQIPPYETDPYNEQYSESYSEPNHSTHSTPRKQAPAPIQIPENPTGSKIQIQRSPPSPSAPTAERHSSLAANHTLTNALSRPQSSSESAHVDESVSAVSGTTLARSLVTGSWIYTPDSRASRYRSGAQDSATLPRSEYPLSGSEGERPDSAIRPISRPSSTMMKRPSSIPPVPPLPMNVQLHEQPSSRSHSHIGSAAENRQNSNAPDARPPVSARLHVDQRRLPPISPIVEATSPSPSTVSTPVAGGLDPDLILAADSTSSSNIPLSDDVAPSSSGHTLNEPTTSSATSATSQSDFELVTEVDDGDPNRSKKFSSSVDSSTIPDSVSGSTPNSTQSRYTPTTSGSAYTSNSSSGKSGVASMSPGSSFGLPSSGSRNSSSSQSFGLRSRTASENPGLASSLRAHTRLPIGGARPLSIQVPGSASSTRSVPISGSRSRSHSNSSVPSSSRLPDEMPLESPDLLDSMLMVSQPVDTTRTRPIRPPPPPMSLLDDIPSPLLSSSAESYSSASAVRQTFPETPYEFSPLWSAKNASPQKSSTFDSATSLQRTAIANRVGNRDIKAPIGPTNRLVRPTTFTPFSPVGKLPRGPLNPASVADVQVPNTQTEAIETQSLGKANRLSAIQEAHPPALESRPVSIPSQKRSSTSSVYSDNDSSLVIRNVDDVPQVNAEIRPLPFTPSELQARATTPSRSPPPSYVPSSSSDVVPSLMRVLLDRESDQSVYSRRSSLNSSSETSRHSSHASSVVPQKRPYSPSSAHTGPISPSPSVFPVDPSTPPGRHSPPPPYVSEVKISPPKTPPKTSSADLAKETPGASSSNTTSTSAKRLTRTRPPLPLGPRKPSSSAGASRARQNSVSSLGSTSGLRLVRQPSNATLTGASVKFQSTPVKFRGMTMEAAQWTFTSYELQEVVSKAIKQSANPAAIRLLPVQSVETAIPEEIARLQALSQELRTNYKLNVRRRNVIVQTLKSMAEDQGGSDVMAIAQTLDNLSDITETLDQISEELYIVTDQITQLTHMQDVHFSSALAMALRKLNTGFLKQAAEAEQLRSMVELLEAERNEAWEKAQEVAQEFDDFTGMMSDFVSPSADVSRRSSRVSVARRNSVRTSKAGLRSSSRMRSNRSSVSSGYRSSTVLSPRSSDDDIPPVPPMPFKTPLGVLISPARTSSGSGPGSGSALGGLTSESPSAESQAMAQAEKELCEMLVSMQDFKDQSGSRPRKRRSMSAVVDVATLKEDIQTTRPNSELFSPPPAQQEQSL